MQCSLRRMSMPAKSPVEAKSDKTDLPVRPNHAGVPIPTKGRRAGESASTRESKIIASKDKPRQRKIVVPVRIVGV